MTKHATVVAMYQVGEGMADVILQWQARLDETAATYNGFIESQVTRAPTAEDSWAAAVTFSSERRLRKWLRSEQRHKLLAEGGALGVAAQREVVFIQGQSPPDGFAVFFHKVAPANSASFMQSALALRARARNFAGFRGSVLLQPGENQDLWISVMRFDSEDDLQMWLVSAERAAAVADLEQYLQEDFQVVTRQAAFGSIVAFDKGVAKTTPSWKIAMIILLVLYPTVMLLTRFLSPLLTSLGLDPGVTIWVGNGFSTIVLTFALMPLATWLFRLWLDPINGSNAQTTIKGVVVLLIVYAITLWIFLEIPYLQFWSQNP